MTDKPGPAQKLVFPVCGWYPNGSIRTHTRALKAIIYYSAVRPGIELANY